MKAQAVILSQPAPHFFAKKQVLSEKKPHLLGSASSNDIENVKSQSLDQLEMKRRGGPQNKASPGLMSAGLINKAVIAQKKR